MVEMSKCMADGTSHPNDNIFYGLCANTIMGTYTCFVDGRVVGSVSADNSSDAKAKAKEKYGNSAESSWNASMTESAPGRRLLCSSMQCA